MLREFSPELIAGEIRVTRAEPRRRSEPGSDRRAA
jgi:hypothetical protein